MQKQPAETIIDWSLASQKLQETVNLWKRKKRTLIESDEHSDNENETIWRLSQLVRIKYREASMNTKDYRRIEVERSSSRSIQQMSVEQHLDDVIFSIRKSLGGVNDVTAYDKFLPQRWFLHDKGGRPFHTTGLHLWACYDGMTGNIKRVSTNLDGVNPKSDINYKPDFSHFVAISPLSSGTFVPTSSRDVGAYFLLRPFRIPDSDLIRVLLTQIELPYPFVDGDVRTTRPREVVLTDQLPVSLTMDSIVLKFREILEKFFTHSGVIL